MALLDRFERMLDQWLPPPEEASATLRRGEALLDADDADGALHAADEALALAPALLRAHALRSDALAALQRPAEALAALEAVHRDRVLPTALLARMIEYAIDAHDEGRALDLEVLLRARLREPDPVVSKRLLRAARAALARQRDALGLRLARAATLADPCAGEAWLLLGRDALSRGDRALARVSLERATANLEVTDARANRLAGELAWALGEHAAAARDLRRAWISGDEGAIATLVAVLAVRDDTEALDRVLATARGVLGDVARGIVGLTRGVPVSEALHAVRGDMVPDVLWHYALGIAVRDAPALAERWAREAPERPAAAAVRALGDARAMLAGGSAAQAITAVRPALAEPITRTSARCLLAEACGATWADGLGAGMAALAALADSFGAHGAALSASMTRARRELDAPLRVALLGEFSAGKSTFLNALVGVEVSPMGVLPTTAQVHWLRDGDPSARIVDLHGSVTETTIAEAPRAVARRREAGVAIERVEVSLPSTFLRRMELIDTPGFNSGDASHDAVLRRAFEIADVAIWLFDARQAGRASERVALAETQAAALPVLGVLNKIDQCAPEDRARLLAHLREGIGALAPCVAAVSARAALSRSDPEGTWQTLTRYLDEHLVANREAWKHARVAHRCRAAVDEALAACDAEDARQRAVQEGCASLLAAIATLREALLVQGPTLRRDVAATLREQLRGVTDDRVQGREALVADAVAEVGWRARARALEAVATELRAVEELSVRAGLMAPDAADVATAAVVQWFDRAVAEGTRDAEQRSHDVTHVGTFLSSDPLVRIEAAAERRARSGALSDETLRIALHAARDALAKVHTPSVPLDGL